ncbi:MAG: sugar phosphorylase [Nitrospirae bacterium]|nr:MAG: sugar phosphorylase [Nitrospirota bacterium]
MNRTSEGLRGEEKTALKAPRLINEGFEISEDKKKRIFRRLSFLYGEKAAKRYLPELIKIMREFYLGRPSFLIKKNEHFSPEERFTEKDIILITYGDLIRGKDGRSIKNLARFCDGYLEGNINTIHILPFFPYTSDRGFAVVDYETVDPNLGSWEDILSLKPKYRLMFDGVFNHVSSGHRWFQEFLGGNPYYRDFFISFQSPDELGEEDRARIFRPRTTDLLTRFETVDGPRYVWTTFSADQIDLNYKNPEVLLRITEVLLDYVSKGADIIRLDAVTFLWKEPGTSCASLPQTHEIVKLFRDVLDIVAPHVALITETNVPHRENISYFGDGTDEAQMVYNFALPPMVLYTFYREDSTRLSDWIEGIEKPGDSAHFFNFLDSHDGIGLMAVKDILDAEEIDFIVQRAKEHGAFVSYRRGRSGKKEPYELNITWFSALNREDAPEDIAYQVRRFVATRIIALMLQGVPGIYLHSLIGTRNDIEAVLATNSKREINRSVIDEEAIYNALADPFSKISRINRELGRLITIRTKQRAFHPNASQKVLRLSPQVLSLYRVAPDESQHLIALVNISNLPCKLEIPLSETGVKETEWIDIVNNVLWVSDGKGIALKLLPYEIVWLVPVNEVKDKMP